MKSDFSDIMARTNILSKAEDILKQKLELNPDDENTIWNLGEILRQKGNLEGALDCYQRLLAIRPDHKKARYLSLIIREESVEYFPLDSESIQPAPFVRIKHFLTNIEQQQIWEHVMLNEKKFVTSEIRDRVDSDYRSSHVLYENELNEITSWFLKKISSRLPKLWMCLQVKPFNISQKEIQLTMHLNGEFFKLHKDCSDKGRSKARRITFVYYFHSLPRRFKGGDLLLFDTDLEEDYCYPKYTRIDPLNNSIIFFPSNFYHQVTPINCETDNIEHGRFTINGWLHEKENLYEGGV